MLNVVVSMACIDWTAVCRQNRSDKGLTGAGWLLVPRLVYATVWIGTKGRSMTILLLGELLEP